MNRYKTIGGAMLAGLCLFVAVQHTVFVLGWIALVPLFSFKPQAVSCKPSSRPSSFFIGLIFGGTLSACAFSWMINGLPAFTGLSVGYGVAAFLLCTLIFSLGCALVLWLAFLIPNPLYLASVWALAEFALQWVAGGLPWFLFHPGNALSEDLYAIQPVSVIGVTGCSFVIVLVNALIAKAIAQRRYKQLLLPVSLFIGFMCWGWLLLVWVERSRPSTQLPTFRLAILQQHIPPDVQWDTANGNTLVQQLLQQERRCIAQQPNMILWSESAIPWTYSPNDDLVKELLHNSDTAKISHILGMKHCGGK